jgi:hypothetical protein
MINRRKWLVVATALACTAGLGCGGSDANKPQFTAPKLGLKELPPPGSPGGGGKAGGTAGPADMK